MIVVLLLVALAVTVPVLLVGTVLALIGSAVAATVQGRFATPAAESHPSPGPASRA